MPTSSLAWVLSHGSCLCCNHVRLFSEYNARQQDRFLFSADTLSSRQLNTVKALVRLGSEAKIRPKVSAQIAHLQFLTNCKVILRCMGYLSSCCGYNVAGFLLEHPAFPELPSILDVDCFLIFVNLHFSISSLFMSLSSPHGHHAPLKGDPIILQLLGITDAHLVRITAAAQIVQFLLTFSPNSASTSTSASTSNSVSTCEQLLFGHTLFYMSVWCNISVAEESQESELTDGKGLQRLWVEYRKLAK